MKFEIQGGAWATRRPRSPRGSQDLQTRDRLMNATNRSLGFRNPIHDRYYGVMKAFVALAIVLTTFNAYAETRFTLGVSTTKAGQEVVLPFSISTDEGAVGFQCDLRFAGEGLKMKPATAGPSLTDHELQTKSFGDDRQRVLVYSKTDTALSDGVVLNIPFEVDPDAANARLTINVLDVVVAGPEGTDIIPEEATVGLLTISDGTSGGSTTTINSVTVSANGSFSFELSSGEDASYRVESSRDLKSWETLGEFETAGGTLQFVDQSMIDGGARFFRATKLN